MLWGLGRPRMCCLEVPEVACLLGERSVPAEREASRLGQGPPSLWRPLSWGELGVPCYSAAGKDQRPFQGKEKEGTRPDSTAVKPAFSTQMWGALKGYLGELSSSELWC